VRYIAILFLLVCLSGCYKYVNMPVWVCPEPKMPVKLGLKTIALPKNSSTEEFFKAVVWDYTYLNGYSKELEITLEGYKKPVVSEGMDIK
jgi:hypothetical protein